VKIWIEEGALEVYNREEAKKEPPQPEILVVSEHKETKISGKGKHKVFPMLVKLLAARTNVFLVGPPGTGKTTLAVQAAEALELPFGSCSLSPDMDSSELLGFLNAAGTYVNTVFHERYTKGGVFLADEIDNGDPNITAKLNQAIENGVCPFPYGMATKHENFRLIVAGNTWGTGPTSQFLGRNALDPATNDRFVHLFVPIDEGLEMAIAKAQNPDKEQVKAWVALVRKWRAAANKQHIRLVVSPRASIVGSRLLAAGVPQEEVAEMLVWRGVDKETRKKVEVD
jgi:cobaltochelatase CobS